MEYLTRLPYLIAPLVGASVGSFLGVVIERQTGASEGHPLLPLSGRSFCFRCRHPLQWWENIPVFSYVVLGGRCSRCRSPIPYWLPLIEIAGAAAGVVVAANVGRIGQIRLISLISLIGLIAVASVFLWIFFSDLVYGVVPDLAVGIGVIGAALFHAGGGAVSHLAAFTPFVLAGAGVASFLALLVVVTRGKGMGTGDVTLGALVGFLTGWPAAVFAVWLAFVLGAVAGVLLIAVSRKRLDQTIPFGPFLLVGSLLAMTWEEAFLHWLTPLFLP
jgi:leader peptidase (prepilin peptidase)/N-methyltransferase